MNYNNYQNQYGAYAPYPYNQNQYQQINNGYNQQQLNNNLNNYNNYQNQYAQQQAQQMRVKCDFIAVSNLEEVKSFIMQPNTTVLFKDVNNKVIYEKKTDSQGISEIKAYQETNIEQSNKNNNNNQYVTIEDFNAFKKEIESKLNGGSNE